MQLRSMHIRAAFRMGLLACLFSAGASMGAGAEDAPFTFSTLRNIAKKQMPCVVNIVTDLLVEESKDDFPLFRFYRNEEGQPPPQEHTQGTGSGFIVSPDGYVVTNNHVVEKSESVEVILVDGTSMAAKVIGTDPQLDLALLKVEPEAGVALASASLGDSDPVQIGDWVLAIGSPYGLSHSVSAGIVSALARDIQSGAYDSYIQTDAAINRGNSGGPLFNIEGEVIGVNTAIMSSSGGSNGIGFAIPINQVKDVLDALKLHGKVTRGWLGVGVKDLGAKEREAMKLEKSVKGALVTDVWEDSPAQKAGLQKDDLIVRFGEATVQGAKPFLMAVARAGIGQAVAMSVLRAGASVELSVTVLERPGELEMSAHSLDPESKVRPKGLGAALQIVDDALRKKYDLAEESEGFVVVEVEKGGASEKVGLEEGDLILELNRKSVTNAGELLSALKDSKLALLLVQRGERSLFLSVELGAGTSAPNSKEN